jgi:hypothetical protein
MVITLPHDVEILALPRLIRRLVFVGIDHAVGVHR